jgi:tetraacyldisaccharide 4'-kinase
MELMLRRAWQRRGLLAWLLLPVGALFFLLAAGRRSLYRYGVLRSHRLPVPVIVVGNITVGGAGKTPLCLALVDALRQAGRHPGIVSRGYGGTGTGPREVTTEVGAEAVGDEPALLRRRADCPLFVGRDRVAAARALLSAHPECDVVVADDGLQHYRLGRDVEIAVVDGRGFGNGWPLPAGPLREPVTRLDGVDAIVVNGSARRVLSGTPTFPMELAGTRFYRLDDPAKTCVAADLAGLRLHACAGIGDPERFFAHLTRLGASFTPHPFPDHHRYAASDLVLPACDAILMTEKDAIKCVGLAPCPVWVLPVTANLPPRFAEFLLEKIDGRPPA